MILSLDVHGSDSKHCLRNRLQAKFNIVLGYSKGLGTPSYYCYFLVSLVRSSLFTPTVAYEAVKKKNVLKVNLWLF